MSSNSPRSAKAKMRLGTFLNTGIIARFTGGLGPVLFFGFGANVITALVGMTAIPMYLSVMGEEAYGIVGFYIVLQGWMFLFDLGVGQAVGRQLSRYRAGAVSADDAVSLFGAAEAAFLAGGLIAGVVFFFSMGWVGRHWLGSSGLPARQVRLALQLAGWLLVARWLVTVYQNALIGLERQIAVNSVSLLGTIGRNGIAVMALVWISHTPSVFFVAWLGVTLLEVAANRLLLARAMPSARMQWGNGWRLMTREFSFAAGITLSLAINLSIGQADRMTLSHTLNLGQFGAFSLVVSLCAGISLVVPPMVQAFQPRLTSLLAQNRRAEFAEIYRLSISLIIVVAAGLAGTMATWPELVVYAWTGDREIAHTLAPTLTFFALGSGIASFLYLPLVLQFAQGLIRLQLIGNLVFGAVWIPAAVWASLRFGTVGAGIVWLLGNLLFLLLWVPLIHRRLLSRDERHGLGLQAWLRIGVLAVLLAATRLISSRGFDRPTSLAFLAVVSLTIMAVATVLSRALRTHLLGIAGIGHPRDQ
jgi:O-antigen/teichoic acid export membrane protein